MLSWEHGVIFIILGAVLTYALLESLGWIRF
jgi:hypothetical protein